MFICKLLGNSYLYSHSTDLIYSVYINVPNKLEMRLSKTFSICDVNAWTNNIISYDLTVKFHDTTAGFTNVIFVWEMQWLPWHCEWPCSNLKLVNHEYNLFFQACKKILLSQQAVDIVGSPLQHILGNPSRSEIVQMFANSWYYTILIEGSSGMPKWYKNYCITMIIVRHVHKLTFEYNVTLFYIGTVHCLEWQLSYVTVLKEKQLRKALLNRKEG